ncbi:MAG: threonine/serine dehydratase [Caulobacter sp.]
MTSTISASAVDEPTAAELPTFADVAAAAERLAGQAVETPLLESDAVNRLLGGRLLVKAEVLQHGGAFKFRGAYNRLVQLGPTERARGVVAFSSGNHAQGVAAAARRLGVRATIVMPTDAPAIKVAATREHGAEIITYDRFTESREAIAARLATERGATLVPSFDDFHVIAGQGTAGLELVAQARARGARLDDVVIPCGGGGLASGCALAIRALSPATRIHCAEPAAFNDHQRSLASGARLSNDPAARSICDALLAPEPGVLTFAVNREILTGGLTASDQEVRAAMAFAFRHFKLVVEPGGAVALACVLFGRIPAADRTIAVVCSGGNVDPDTFAAALAQE